MTGVQTCALPISQNFAAAFVNYTEHKLSFERVSEVLLLPEETVEWKEGITERPAAQETGWGEKTVAAENCRTEKPPAQECNGANTFRNHGSVIFDHVSVSYEGRQILNEISFTASPGECVCIRGDSGSGKSTLAKALMQMVDYQGEISINGKNCKELPLDTLRKQIAFSPEHSDLFHTSVYENILFGNPDAAKEAVYRAADRSAVTDLETFLGRDAGEDGELLSGGQKQRVSFARTLLRDSPIFILDEPTAALDTESETKILKTISDLKQEGKCILLITHKESTMHVADRIVQL